ncbi:hypothetical protein Nham_3027 [Nitrobacter hamburgensis X14]|uniref:Parallel beta-helix repeat n=1 Tax=Nitrobacter hamburgensis (strain DSM 10229 / NCIMB 13809 / X14) TaxID=323097 RepID=Q1QJ24_NITHX|nr:Ig-like domain-containing protein [Nitrobacter hamburgensis]ABE63773.1 hypothetical protein Nham_3027 [Nitrobacter hamburgensis X14]
MASTTPSNGWPDATSTGVPAGVTLTASGDVIIDKPGTVISGLNIRGSVYINADNVTVENCQITSSGWAVVKVKSGVTGAVVQDCTIDGTGHGPDGTGNEGIMGQGTFLRNNISNVENGITITGNNSVIMDNYIHDLNAGGSPHYDGIQIDGGVSNIQISHNSIINQRGWTSAIMIDNYFGAASNISVDNNLLVGGAYTVYSDGSFSSSPITGVSFTNNHIGGGAYGPAMIRGSNPVYTGNIDDGATLAQGLQTTGQPSGSQLTTPELPHAPDAPTIASFSNDSGVAGDGITNDNTLALKGTAAANSTVKVFDGATQIGTATASGSGAWSFTTAALADGKHSLTAKAADASGQTSAASSALGVTIDTKAPDAPVEVDHSVVNGDQLLLKGTAEANSTIKVFDGTTVVGTAKADASGNWSVQTSSLSSGTHVLTATATDAAGNTSPQSLPFDPVIEKPAPTPPLSAPKILSVSEDTGVAGDLVTSDNTLTLEGTAAANSTVKVFDGTTQIGTATANDKGAWSFTTATLTDGKHNLTAKAMDASGQTSAASSALGVTIDTHPPAAPKIGSISSDGKVVSDGIVHSDHVTFTGTGEANSTVKIYDGTTQIGTATANNKGAWTYTADTLKDGSHQFSAKAIDLAGNISGASKAQGLTIDSHAAGSGGTTGPADSHGWPDATTTGVPAGVTLTASGDVIIDKPGTVISGFDIRGGVYINANNVTVENCKITSSGWAAVKVKSGVTGAVVQDCTIDGTGHGPDGTGNEGIMGQGTFLRNNISNVENGITITGSNSVIKDNYIHHLKAGGSPHYDGIQIDGGVSNIQISHNSIINQNGGTSAIMIDNYFGAVSNVAVNNNLLVGGAYTVYADGSQGSKPITGVSFTDNHIGGGQYGPALIRGNKPVYTGNVDDGATLAQGLHTTGQPSGSLQTSTTDAPHALAIASVSNDGGVVGDGTHSLTAKAVDVSGQASAASSVPGVTIDTKAPDAPKIGSISSDGKVVSDGVAHSGHVSLAGTAEAHSTVKVYDGTTQIGTATANDKGAWTYDAAALKDGSHQFSAKAMDLTGNISGASKAQGLTVDTHTDGSSGGSSGHHGGGLSADFTSMFHNGNDTVTFKGTADPYSQISIYDNGKGDALGVAKAGADGKWSFNTKSAVSDTVHNFTAEVTNKAGHTGSSSGSAILGTGGNDVLKSTSGNDLFHGHGGHDTFVFAPNFGADVITDFRASGRSHDVVQFSKSVFDNFADVLSHAAQSGHDVAIDSGGGNTLTLKDTKLAALDKTDFHFV